eukprot:Polyplicarium_translucidae@DN2452_c0_g1_i1.p1
MLTGIRCTHQPSPWIGDWGWFRIQFSYADAGWNRGNAYDPWKATFRPYLFETDIIGVSQQNDGQLKVSFTAGNAGSVLRLKFPKFDVSNNVTQDRAIFFSRSDQQANCTDDDVTVEKSGGKTILKSFTDNLNWGKAVANMDKYRVHVYMEIDAEIMTDHDISNDDKSQVVTMRFDKGTDEFLVKTSTSYISIKQAERNMIAGTFDEAMADHKDIWNKQLSVLKVKDTGFGENEKDLEETNIETFYSNLWRTSLYPRDLAEWNGEEWVHWSPFKEDYTEPLPGHLSTDSGFWDAYHTVYTVLELLWPERLVTALEGYINAYEEGGWFPQWSAPGYMGSMVGTMSDCSFSSAIVKGFSDKDMTDGFPLKEALEGMKKNAFTEDDDQEGGVARGRRGINIFREKGYIPKNYNDSNGAVHEVVSRTLNHAQADYCILQATAKQGDLDIFSDEDIAALETGQGNWKELFNNDTKFFASRDNETGDFAEHFDQYLWGGDYTEGGPWQFRFYAPHDVVGLGKFYGGPEDLCDKVNEMNTHPSYFHRGQNNYGQAIHEMIEMGHNVWGQYSHNNQPTHHAQYYPIAAYGADPDNVDKEKCLHTAQKWIKKTLTECYTSTRYTGDEDNGEMAGWYILSALGFYDMAPASPDYILGVPLFREVEVAAGDMTFTVKAENNCWTCDKVTGVKIDDTDLDDYRVSFAELKAGTTLEFLMESS